MRKWLIGVLLIMIVCFYPQRVEASTVNQNDVKAAKETVTEESLEGFWGNEKGFVCEFHNGEFTGFTKKNTKKIDTYEFQLDQNVVKLSQFGQYSCKCKRQVLSSKKWKLFSSSFWQIKSSSFAYITPRILRGAFFS